MKQYFKDYKTKMLKEEDEISKQQSPVNFQPEALSETSKGIFVKRKVLIENSDKVEAPGGFRFNFGDPAGQEVSQVTSKVNSMKLS